MRPATSSSFTQTAGDIEGRSVNIRQGRGFCSSQWPADSQFADGSRPLFESHAQRPAGGCQMGEVGAQAPAPLQQTTRTAVSSVHCQTLCHTDSQTDAPPPASQHAAATILQEVTAAAMNQHATACTRGSPRFSQQMPDERDPASAHDLPSRPLDGCWPNGSHASLSSAAAPGVEAMERQLTAAALPPPHAQPTGGTRPFQPTPPQASYRLTVWTKDAPGAWTEGRPGVTIFGANGGSTGEQALENGKAAFERGGVDVCRFVANDVRGIERIALTLGDDFAAGG